MAGPLLSGHIVTVIYTMYMQKFKQRTTLPCSLCSLNHVLKHYFVETAENVESKRENTFKKLERTKGKTTRDPRKVEIIGGKLQ